ncbi:MAG TPA: HAD family hydrolase [Candidatus Dormibacteraeota bacterium]
MIRFEAVLFDFGDTLFHSPSGADVMAEAGVDPEVAERLWAEIWASSKAPEALARGRDRTPELHASEWRRLFAPAEQLVPGMAALLYERVLLPLHWTPYPDTEPVLRELRQRGARVGVISNIASPLRPVFARHRLADYVDSYTHSYEHALEKPDQQLFRLAAERLGAEPERVLMVGDNHLADGGAVLVGMTVLLLPMVKPGEERGLAAVLKLA